MKPAPEQRLPALTLCLLTSAAVLIHGYHLGTEDGEIYVPAAKKFLHPDLYPYASEFFLSHERLSSFAAILAWTARITRLSMDWTIAIWYVATIFATLLGCWMLAAISFRSARARWCSLLVVTAVLTMPATNTGLLLMDPYLTARSFSTPLTLITLACVLRRRYVVAAALIVLTAAIHIQMAVYLVLLTGTLWLVQRRAKIVRDVTPEMAYSAFALPVTFHFGPAQEPYREALYARGFYFLSTWTWYHWLGMLAPLAFLSWCSKGKVRGTTPEFRLMSCAVLPFGVLAILVAAIFASSHEFDMFARLQPLRCFHLITLIFVLYLGGTLGEYFAQGRTWVLPLIFVSLAGGMAYVNLRTYPDSPHIELPGIKSSSNAWIDTLLWVRENTPKDAVFAVDSRYFKDEGVDVHGFRAISERSGLADYFKDGGVVAIFPPLAAEWKQMSDATFGLNQFDVGKFERLAQAYPVTWTVIHGSAPIGMVCPYQQQGFAVCQIPGASGISHHSP